MKLIKSMFDNKVKVFKPEIYSDQRGYFSELYNSKKLSKIGIKDIFVQDNISFSKIKYTFRGLHLQLHPSSQSKIVRCSNGSFLDIIVDMRIKSKTYCKYHTITITDKNMYQVYIPKNFAHGLITLEKNTLVNYKTSGYYDKEKAISLSLYEPKINFKFKTRIPKLIMSNNDKNPISLEKFENLQIF